MRGMVWLKVRRGIILAFMAGLSLVQLGISGGCGCNSGPPIVPVTGLVKVGGYPVPNASVTFQPLGMGEPSTGTTDSAGKFSLKTLHDDPGAAVGKHMVSIQCFVTSPLARGERKPPGDPAPDGFKTDWIVPEKYSRLETSGLVIEVKSGLGKVELDLKP